MCAHVSWRPPFWAGSELRSRAGTVIPFPIMKGNLPDAWILSYTRRPTKKTHGDRVSSGRPVDFGSTPREVRKSEKWRARTSAIGPFEPGLHRLICDFKIVSGLATVLSGLSRDSILRNQHNAEPCFALHHAGVSLSCLFERNCLYHCRHATQRTETERCVSSCRVSRE